MGIEHDFFGFLEAAPDGALYWSENVEFDDQSVSVSVTAQDENDIRSGALDAAAAFVRGLHAIDRNAREGMVSELGDRTSEVTEYVLQRQEEYGAEIEDFFSDVSGDVAIDIIKALQLTTMVVLLDEHERKNPFVVLEYALDADAIDEVLLVNVATDGSVLSITSAQ